MPGETHAHHFTNQAELWKDWKETIIRMRGSILESNRKAQRTPLHPSMMKPDTFFHQWYSAANEAWILILGGMENFEQFMQTQYQFVEAFMQASKEMSRFIQEIIFPYLQLPTRSDITRLEKVVVSLEERIYTLEDALVSFEEDDLRVGIDQAVKGHLERDTGKLDSIDISSILQQTEESEDLSGHLERVEIKLDRLLTMLERLESSSDRVSDRTQHVTDIERE